MVRVEICDDCPSFAEALKLKLEKTFEKMNTEAEFTLSDNLADLKSHLDSYKIDVVFLDIMLNGKSSVDWCRENLINSNLQLIFMTSYPEEAYNISEVEHAYFLVKSRTDDEVLRKAAGKVLNNLSNKNPNLLILKVGKRNITVNMQDICYFEGKKNNVIVHLNDGAAITLYTTLKEFTKKVSPNFLKVHKSFVINMNYVKETFPHEFVLKNDVSVSVNPRKYKALVKAYSDYVNRS